MFPSFFPVREKSKLSFLILKDLDEAKAYMRVDVLRDRLIEITEVAKTRLAMVISPNILFGTKDDADKFWECITLFFILSIHWKHNVVPNRDFQRLNEVCEKTLSLLHPDATGRDRLHQRTIQAVKEQDKQKGHEVIREASIGIDKKFPKQLSELESKNHEIKVLTYNVAQEIQKYDNICHKDDKCIKNICIFIDATDCDFIGIQEYSNIAKLREYSKKLDSMRDSHEKYPPAIKKYGPITFYNETKYKLDKDCNTMKFGFNGPLGRCVQINFFNNNLCVINVHAGHDKGVNDITTFDMSLKTFLEGKFSERCKNIFIEKLHKYNIIMLGDMNSDIINFDHITIDGVKRKLYGRTLEPTCCTDVKKMNGVNVINFAFDHILTTSSKTIDRKVYKGLEFHSDHNPVISIIRI